MRRFVVLAGVVTMLLAPSLIAQQKPSAETSRWAPDVAEPGSVEAIASVTTDSRFVSPWVAYVPDSKTVPSPTRFLGHLAGAPGELSERSRRRRLACTSRGSAGRTKAGTSCSWPWPTKRASAIWRS